MVGGLDFDILNNVVVKSIKYLVLINIYHGLIWTLKFEVSITVHNIDILLRQAQKNLSTTSHAQVEVVGVKKDLPRPRTSGSTGISAGSLSSTYVSS